LLVAGAAATLLVAAGYYLASKKPKHVEEVIKSRTLTTFTDSEKGTLHYLTKQEALDRSSVVANVSYKLALALITGG
jgi:hypothetical protein